jgi:heat shock protein 5
MIREAEEFADEDKETKARVDAKNALENYIYSMRNSVEDAEKLADKLTDEEKATITETIEEAQTWLNENMEASKEDF